MHSSDLWSSHQAWLAEPSPVTGCEIGIWCYRAINFRDSRTFFLQFFGTERNKPVEKLVQCFSNLAPTSKLCCNCSFRAHYRSMSIDPVLGMCQVLKNVWKFWSLLFRRFWSFKRSWCLHPILHCGMGTIGITGNKGPHAATGVLVSSWFSGLHPWAPGPDGSRCLHGWISVTHSPYSWYLARFTEIFMCVCTVKWIQRAL